MGVRGGRRGRGARRACRGRFCPGNLYAIPAHNFATDWLDDRDFVGHCSRIFRRALLAWAIPLVQACKLQAQQLRVT